MTHELLTKELFTYIQEKYKMNDKKAKIVLNIAESLYQKCLQNYYDAPRPVEWFLDEDKYKNKWLEIENWFNELSDKKFKELFCENDSYNIYLKFMHDQFKTVA